MSWRNLVLAAAVTCFIGAPLAVRAADEGAPKVQAQKEAPIDFQKARQLMQRRQQGEKLTAEEQAYLERAMEARRAQERAGNPNIKPREQTGFKPLTEMSADDKYKDQDGGLYGGGKNSPPAEHQKAAEAALAKIQPLNKEGKPADNGTIGFISISMSNATQEFSRFKQVADADPDKSKKLTIVDCAQGGQAMAEWVDPKGQPWQVLEQRLDKAGISDEQVQIVWIKLANKGPRGDLAEHGKKLQQDTQAVIQNASARFPSLKLAYLSSRIYGGYAGGALNPEPYAYESAFVVRWLIQDQIKGDKALNFDSAKGDVKAPVLLWGPYLWADGTKPRESDKLVYTREDLGGDGTHPSRSGVDKVVKVMLDFYKTDPLAKGWFVGK